MSDLQRRLAGKSLPRGLPPRPSLGSGLRGGGARSRGGARGGARRSYTGVSWRKYWRDKQLVATESRGTFCVYHGGSRESSVAAVLLHGAGYSGLTWSLMADHLATLADCGMLAIDLRGHGETEVTGDAEDMSGAAMAADVAAVLGAVYRGADTGVVLVGHSMGGALAALTAELMSGQEAEPGLPRLLGLVVEDVVEGTALEALAGMHTVLQSRPRQFASLEQAVEWAVRAGQVRNLDSARVSMPGQVVAASSGRLAAALIQDTEEAEAETSEQPSKRGKVEAGDSIQEEEESGDTEEAADTFKAPRPVEAAPPAVDRTPPETFTGPGVYRWRADLARTEPHWTSWFQGLSARFLAAPGAKLLLLAGVDRLDRELTVGQMQGRFQMQVLPQVGHTVHEDSPDRVAEVIASFLVRNKFCQPLDNFAPQFPGC